MKVCFIKYKKIVALLAVTIILIGIMVFSNSKAANTEGSVDWKTVSQDINSSDEYIYDGSETDSTMSNAFVYNSSDGNWYFISNGVVAASKSGMAFKNDGQYSYTNGKMDKLSGIAKAGDGNWYDFASSGKRQFTSNGTLVGSGSDWYYIVDGKWDSSYSGFAENENGIWRVDNGKVNFKYHCSSRPNVYENIVKITVAEYPQFVSQDTWAYFKDGKWDRTAENVSKNDNGWWYVKDGVVDFDAKTVAKNNTDGTWWAINEGAVNFNFTGISANSIGIWYVEGGRVNFNYNGTYNGYTFSGGKYIGGHQYGSHN